MYTLNDLPIGTRVELSPSCDCWMRGDRYGEVVATAPSSRRRSLDTIKVKLDKSGKTVRLAVWRIYDIVQAPHTTKES